MSDPLLAGRSGAFRSASCAVAGVSPLSACTGNCYCLIVMNLHDPASFPLRLPWSCETVCQQPVSLNHIYQIAHEGTRHVFLPFRGGIGMSTQCLGEIQS